MKFTSIFFLTSTLLAYQYFDSYECQPETYDCEGSYPNEYRHCYKGTWRTRNCGNSRACLPNGHNKVTCAKMY
ncbi:hypothetical protein CONCODRAFT_80906 [Conidiobolus coronatus NRRL 28638]|uniref:Carbohydrate-binding module family 19 domain-containing protein n=1 Tax=Conidiobolus coronatus (strain ATCC 28846 / CBS 209.66 / NRRL 28638) TaxID=796925 RepID=A0A137NQ37_CONC2|nr:hypothetical protein CONCODRAFT_80906 [Conidiobolus coronatus NRRL 28638]|eukprot:KXN64862.1 hypothetical protein CONCODRAFT_80906 [Conidiobolus coronatus NRRL 28638]